MPHGYRSTHSVYFSFEKTGLSERTFTRWRQIYFDMLPDGVLKCVNYLSSNLSPLPSPSA